MILELADLRIVPGRQVEFEATVQQALASVVAKSPGFKGWKLNHSVETPERYVLMLFWNTLEDHTVTFRNSPLFTEWRALVGPFFTAPPAVEHFELVGKSA